MKKGSKTRDLDKRQTNVEKQRQKKMRSELFIDQLVFYSMIHTERKKKMLMSLLMVTKIQLYVKACVLHQS